MQTRRKWLAGTWLLAGVPTGLSCNVDPPAGEETDGIEVTATEDALNTPAPSGTDGTSGTPTAGTPTATTRGAESAYATSDLSSGSTSDDASSSGTSGGPGGGSAVSPTGSGADSNGCVDHGISVVDFSYIWIANSTQGTVSKIDTVSAVEAGRYLVDDYEGASISNCQGPSRTSVNLNGDVAVLDRGGGIAKIIADPDACPDADFSGSIQTSSDANYLPWGTDECVAWQIDLPRPGGSGDCDGPRTVQWTAPEPLGNCEYSEPRVWVAFCNENDDDVTVQLLDGADGTLVQETALPGYGCNTYGPYGGVVDSNNNLYFVDRSSGQSLYRIDYDCTQVEETDCWTEFERPAGENAYGITIDLNGRIWIAGQGNSLYAFDTATETYTSYQAEVDAFFADGPADSNGSNTLRGLVADAEGVLWIASITSWGGGANPGILRVDTSVSPLEIDWYGPNTLQGIVHAAGTSIDVEGYVWLVDTLGNQAFKIDPVAPEMHDVVTGLQYPYTYSDMTGFSLSQVLPQ